MPTPPNTVLKNVISFSALVVGVPVALPHGLVVNNVDVIPQLVAANSPNFTVTATATTVTVTRLAPAADAVKIYVEHWHTIEEVYPAPPHDVGTIPFIIASGDGIAGSGTINTIEDENVAVAGAPHSILNFTGAGVAATDAGAGQVNVTIAATISTIEDEGGAVAGAPHTTLNFAGAGVTATDAGGGQVNITIPATISTIEDENAPVAGSPHTIINFAGAGVTATDAGAGQVNVTIPATIATIEDEDAPVAGSPHTILNFTGDGVTATDAGGGQVNITIPGGGAVATPGTVSMFFGQTAGTGSAGNDYAATVAVGAPVPFPEDGPAIAGASVIRDGVSTIHFVVDADGIYEVSWAVAFLEASQLQLAIVTGAGPFVYTPIANTTTLSGAGTQQNTNTVLVTLVAEDVFALINPAGNAAALTVQTADGNLTHAQAPSLVAKYIGL